MVEWTLAEIAKTEFKIIIGSIPNDHRTANTPADISEHVSNFRQVSFNNGYLDLSYHKLSFMWHVRFSYHLFN